MTKIYFIDDLYVKPGQADALIEAFKPIQKLRLECAACLVYAVYRDALNPDHFILYETWTSQEAYDHHNNTVKKDNQHLWDYRNSFLSKGIDVDQYFKLVV